MAPSVTANLSDQAPIGRAESKATPVYPRSLRLNGSLDRFEYEEATPVIGREYFNVNIVDDIITAKNSEDLLRDLAITVSRRGVVFFRSQDNLTDEAQKQLVHRLGQLGGKPAESYLHVNPVVNNSSEFGVDDSEISSINSANFRKMLKQGDPEKKTLYANAGWHSDIPFEPVPSDYTLLRLVQVPKSGGDTLWASGYEVYDRFSGPYQRFLEGLTATFVGDGFLKAAADSPGLVHIHTEPRGHPLNSGSTLTATHPVVRTNPVTGWKSVFALGPYAKRINDLSEDESNELIRRIRSMVTECHDTQVRFRWRNRNDVAIWDNRSVFHTGTYDYDGFGERVGNRAASIGEVPYFDPASSLQCSHQGPLFWAAPHEQALNYGKEHVVPLWHWVAGKGVRCHYVIQYLALQ